MFRVVVDRHEEHCPYYIPPVKEVFTIKAQDGNLTMNRGELRYLMHTLVNIFAALDSQRKETE